MSDTYILAEDGKTPVRVAVVEWSKWLEGSRGKRTVKFTEKDGVRVSTVFLGLDHSFCGGPPLLFETLVFEGPHDGDMERYVTWDEAIKGHEAMVKRVFE